MLLAAPSRVMIHFALMCGIVPIKGTTEPTGEGQMHSGQFSVKYCT